MGVAHGDELAGCLELIERVLTNRLEHAKPGLGAIGLIADHQALRHERVQPVQRVGGVGDRLGSLERPPAAEDRHTAKQGRGRRIKELVAPLDGGAQRLLALGSVPRPAGQQAQAMVEAQADRLRGEHAQPRRRELDRQGEPVEGRADFGDRIDVVGGQPEVGVDALSAFDEQPHGVTGAPRQGVGPRFGVRERERAEAVFRLTTDAQRRAAGGEHADPGTRGGELRDEWPGVRQLLQVVEHEQHLGGGESCAHHLLR